jgi:PAS domain S-box-containing protein
VAHLLKRGSTRKRASGGALKRKPTSPRLQADPATDATRPDLLALAIAGANDGLWDWDARTGYVYRSPRTQAILGQPAQPLEATREAWLALIHPDDLEHYKNAVLAHFRGRSNQFECEYRIRHADGTYRWLLDRAIAVRDDKGRVYRMAGSVGDITARKEMEKALRDSEQRFRDYAESSSDWFWETDANHRFVDTWNRFPSGPLPLRTSRGKQRWDIAVDVEAEPEKWREHRAVLDRHEPFRNFTYEIGMPDGTTRYISVSGKPVFDAEGRFGGYRGSGRDVTETMTQDLTLRQAMVDAEAANAAKTQFLANMSHELRTPLNAILGFSEVIKDEMFGPIGNPRYREYAEDILRSGRHLLELISDILDMSKIEAGKLVLHEEPIKLDEVVESCLPLVRQRAAESGVALKVEVPAALPALFADETRLRQILLNLLTNAVKFTPHGGYVRVGGHLAPGGAFVLEVEDSGIGMSQQDIALALLPFHQIDNASAKRFEGTGLGLPLTKRLVELHGGVIEIDSALGRGTTVTIRFPASRMHPPVLDPA